MLVIKGNIQRLRPLSVPVALTVGNFDGVHRGHTDLLQSLKKTAFNRGLKTALLSFEPHPQSLLDNPSFKPIQTENMKIRELEKQGLDFLVIQNFDKKFASVSKKDFLTQYLLIFFNIHFFLFGYDFCFGRKGKGDFDFTKNFLKNKKEIGLEKARAFETEQGIVSSSKIRNLLNQGQVEKANENLGRPFSLEGKVTRGRSLGKKLGYPTANLKNISCLIPSPGVYAGWVILNDKKRPAVMNIGQRPSIQEQKKEISSECHIINFCGNLYDQKLCFYFIKKLRDEKKFSNLDNLKKQIKKDVLEAAKILQNKSGGMSL